MKNYLNKFFLFSAIKFPIIKFEKNKLKLLGSINKTFINTLNQDKEKSNIKINKNFNKIFPLAKKEFSRIDYSYDTRDFLGKTSEYEKNINDSKVEYTFTNIALKGYANAESTYNYTKRNIKEVHKDHFREIYNSNIKISSLGLGTYMGAPDDINDFYIYNAVKSCVLSGAVNLIDTAINYRYMKSEKAIGKALNALVNKYGYKREEFFICSKIGYVPEDAEGGRRSQSFVQDLVEEKKIEIEDIIYDEKNRPIHCMHPNFLEEQMEISLRNLGLETLDLMYLHNAVESQGAVLTPESFEKRLTKAFEFFVRR
jgi:hypothetical protein